MSTDYLSTGLSVDVVSHIKSILTSYPEIQKVILYGSRAKGTHRPGSDIDISFKGDDLNLQILNKIQNQLDDLNLPYEWDVSHYDKIDNPDFKNHIDRVGIVL